MIPETERSLLLQQLKNYLLFLRESGHTHVPLNSELSELPVMATPSGTFHDSSPQPLESQMTPNSFSLEPGPLFSRILNELQEAQVEGEVKGRDEAFSWVSDYLKRTITS